MVPELTQAEACRVLERTGLHRPAAVRVLQCGFAGRPRRVGGGPVRVGKLLYDERRVWDLVTRPFVRTRAPERVSTPAALVVRSGPRRASELSACGWEGVDLTAPREEQLEAVRRTRWMAVGSYATTLVMRLDRGRVPLVVTVGSFVAITAEVIGIDLDRGRTVLTVGEPGPWSRELTAARVHSGPGAERRWLAIEGLGRGA